ncbi:ribosomal-processing cysteine protease Prp [Clostridium sp.]|uniref:ribosomal-processing cysteine protease Prp n=1 Tax=Clostridium sp. TaxID=1506 RepID=UPI0026DBDFD2|nr:ribosomal-processing cysteine protease Prp [Clostridium sp.]MDO5039582.1 ribosomal-processing cysteine protease Prp [Clostridium sp.]
MISAKILRKKDNIIGFIIDSHAMPEDRDFNNDVLLVGEAFDMVCNSVSVLSQSVLIGIDEVLKLNCTYEMADGYLKLDLTDFSEEELKQSQVLLKTFEKSLESVIFSLDEMFGINKRREYINLLKEEV